MNIAKANIKQLEKELDRVASLPFDKSARVEPFLLSMARCGIEAWYAGEEQGNRFGNRRQEKEMKAGGLSQCRSTLQALYLATEPEKHPDLFADSISTAWESAIAEDFRWTRFKKIEDALKNNPDFSAKWKALEEKDKAARALTSGKDCSRNSRHSKIQRIKKQFDALVETLF